MNKHTKRLFILVTDNKVVIASTNLTDFHRKLIAKKIGYTDSRVTLRNRFLTTRIIPHYDAENGVVYNIQQFEEKPYQ